MAEILISMIAAVAANNVIGADNDMPWRLSTDLKRFKALTMGKPIIMGRHTFESVGKALPGRLNVVITRNRNLKLDGAVVADSLDDALIIAKIEAFKTGQEEVMITGGGQIYAEAMEHADRLYITHVEATPNGDTVFPMIDGQIWKISSEEAHPRGEKDSAKTIYRIYQRIAP